MLWGLLYHLHCSENCAPTCTEINFGAIFEAGCSGRPAGCVSGASTFVLDLAWKIKEWISAIFGKAMIGRPETSQCFNVLVLVQTSWRLLETAWHGLFGCCDYLADKHQEPVVLGHTQMRGIMFRLKPYCLHCLANQPMITGQLSLTSCTASGHGNRTNWRQIIGDNPYQMKLGIPWNLEDKPGKITGYLWKSELHLVINPFNAETTFV